ncbi:MAG: hypothetical protein MJ157_06305, partial [Clostridia bacterium]|nr:hypothetical protein [Clostridia bacterium]
MFSGLVLGRVVILGDLHPFLPATAALLAVFLPWENGLWALAALELSLALVSSGAEQLSSGIATGAIYGLILIWKRKRKVGVWTAGAIAGSGCLLFKAVILNNTGYYHLLNLLFEALLAAVLACVLFKLPAAILAIRLRRSLTGEELISLFIWAAALVVGCGNLDLVGLRIGEILSQVLILLAAFIGGAGLGAAAGAAVGVLPLLISLPLAS